MQSITFTCEVITPMFLNGADGQTPELRAPSIKGAMRFWWRALHAHLPLQDTKDERGNIVSKGLKTLEAEIFGGSGNNVSRSKILIRVLQEEDLQTERANLVPHRHMPQQAFSVHEKFKVLLSITSHKREEEQLITLEKLSALFQLTCYLGGFGKRVRRGMGSVNIAAINGDKNSVQKEVDLKYIHTLINQFSNFYTWTPENVFFNYSGRSPKYGYIKQIELGRSDSNLLTKISKATHDEKQKAGYAYDASMGHAFKGRYASPVYVSVVPGSIRPIITTLNIAPDKNEHQASLIIQENFKNRIL